MPTPCVVFGGPSLEHDVSILTGLQAARVLAKSGEEPVALYWSESNRWFRVPADLEASAFLDGVPASARPVVLELAGTEPGFYEARSLGRRTRIEVDAVLICCHGGPGEDGRLQAAFDLAGIAYTGPNSACASLTMDKLSFSGVIAAAGLPALPRIAWNAASPAPSFTGPYILKPRFGGSSIGIEIVDDVETVRDMLKASSYYTRGAVIEPYRTGLEDLYIAIRTHPKLQLSLIERPGKAVGEAKIYGYQQKYLQQRGAESQVSEIPARLPDEVAKRMRVAAEEIADLTRLTGNARLDFLWDGSDLFINELNPIPGALALRLWAESGVTRDQLLADMLAEARVKRSATADIDPPDRQADDRKAQTLRSAGSIAQKLV
jgi:D-alanine-D-alanine ligase